MPRVVDIYGAAPYGKTDADIEAAVVARSHAIWGQVGRPVAPPDPRGHVLLRAAAAMAILAVALILGTVVAHILFSDDLAKFVQIIPAARVLPEAVDPAAVPLFAAFLIGGPLFALAVALGLKAQQMLRLTPQKAERAVSTRNVGRRRRLWLLAMLFGTVGVILFALFVKMTADLNRGERFIYDIMLTIVVLGGGVLIVNAAAYIGKRAYQLGQPSASELQAKDPRPPVLLLRSFHDEDLKIARVTTGQRGERKYEFVRMEEAVSDQFAPYGPLIAIGKPGEALPTAGAARNYYSDEEWKDAVAKFMDEAQILLVIAGLTSGLGWELEAMERRGHIGKLLVLMPPAVAGWGQWFRSLPIVGSVVGALAKVRIVPDTAAAARQDLQQRWDILRRETANVAAFTELPVEVPEGTISLHLGRDLKPTIIVGPYAAAEEDYERAIRIGVYGMFCHA